MNDYNNELFEEPTEGEIYPPLPEKVEVIGVRFKRTGKIYYFDPQGVACSVGDEVIVATSRGVEYGTCAVENRIIDSESIVPPLRHMLRKATEDDRKRYLANIEEERKAMQICRKMIEKHGLEMKLVGAEYPFDNGKLLFYFTANGRIDFRELVKDLANTFKIRIELRQIGIRDETKLVGGLGACGRPLCCNTFLCDFSQVSIKMAKEQGLALNSAKLSGTCGKLMCCLRYEHDTYAEEQKLMPKPDSEIKTPDGLGIVTEAHPIAGTVKVKFDNNQTITYRTYKLKDLNKAEEPAAPKLETLQKQEPKQRTSSKPKQEPKPKQEAKPQKEQKAKQEKQSNRQPQRQRNNQNKAPAKKQTDVASQLEQMSENTARATEEKAPASKRNNRYYRRNPRRRHNKPQNKPNGGSGGEG